MNEDNDEPLIDLGSKIKMNKEEMNEFLGYEEQFWNFYNHVNIHIIFNY